MKILNAHRQPAMTRWENGAQVVKIWQYFVVLDKMPKLTYEKVGADYIGSAVNDDGNIIFSHHLKKERFGDAFAGRPLTLEMKDGSVETIKDYWFDNGAYNEHGEFYSIGVGTPETLKNVFVFMGANIQKDLLDRMLDEYFRHRPLQTYREIEREIRVLERD